MLQGSAYCKQIRGNSPWLEVMAPIEETEDEAKAVVVDVTRVGEPSSVPPRFPTNSNLPGGLAGTRFVHTRFSSKVPS